MNVVWDGYRDTDDPADSGPVNRLNATKPAEPVLTAEGVRLLFAALATVGWVVVPSDTVNIIASAVAAVISIVATVLARRKVTPTS